MRPACIASLSRQFTTVMLCVIGAASAAAAQGTSTGRVTAQGTNGPLGDVRVIVVGSSAAAVSAQDGKYTVNGVRVGNVDVQVLRVGYNALKKSVLVQTGATATLDFQMTVALIKLPDVVTTATGQTRKVELGNAISTLGDVGARVEQSSITSVSDL